MKTYSIRTEDADSRRLLHRDILTTLPIYPVYAWLHFLTFGLKRLREEHRWNEYTDVCRSEGILPGTFLDIRLSGDHPTRPRADFRYADNGFPLREASQTVVELLVNGGKPAQRRFSIVAEGWSVFKERFLETLLNDGDTLNPESHIGFDAKLEPWLRPFTYVNFGSEKDPGTTTLVIGEYEQRLGKKDVRKLDAWFTKLRVRYHSQ